ncbi:MMPL family transporter [Acidiferrimicrobium sp. IK]|uniref:MMPL family transporter n=1 Tax=Acidiferrimicrobium sp. IK TaxID=2871700 RepID=UPI0021CB0D88|nr:MMPL family transporter [Acidiferrimicrobium sp. IK]MCU4183279.1 MMPL family transporter [Acidiferrimicrobium sp. IK]
MFNAIGRLVTARRKAILWAALGLVVVSAVLGIHAPGALKSGGFTSSSAPSQVAQDRLRADFGGSTNLILVVTARSGSVDTPAVTAAGDALTARLAATPDVSAVTSYWPTRPPALRSDSGTQAIVAARVAGSDSEVTTRTKALVERLSNTGPGGPIEVVAGGDAPTGVAINSQINADLAKAESIAIPVTLVLLIAAYGSVVAALLPVAIGVLAIFATLAVLYLLSLVTDVSIYSLNLTTALSLGLGVDYSLLMVGRYREELAAGRDPRSAVRRSVATAGRTIVFSAGAVAAALAALIVFPVYFLRSFAYAGISVVAVAALAALVVLPAILLSLGTRVNALRVPWGRHAGVASGQESRFWRRVAAAVMRRPLAAGLPVVAALVVLMVPFFGVHFGTPDDRVLPSSSAAHQAGNALRGHFPADAADTIDVVTAAPLGAPSASEYARAISLVPGVVAVDGPGGRFAGGAQVAPATPVDARYQAAAGTWLSAVIAPDPLSGAAAQVVHQVRAVPVPGHTTTAAVGGQAASLLDQKHDLGGRLPLAIALIVATTLIVLWLFTGSVVLPLKALALNALSLTAVFGAVVWVFQDGHLSGLLDFTPTPTSTTMPILLFCIAFGLSMDYEVFMLSRIKEIHDEGRSNEEAVVAGLARTGGIVSTAAALLAVTFVAFGLSKVSFIQLFGLGTALAIVVDATLVRGVLVPAFMRLAGDANWWSPGLLRRLHDRVGVNEAPGADPAPAVLAEVGA